MPITEIESGDFVNAGRDKFNANFGLVPIDYTVDEDGNLLVTLHNGQVLSIPLGNFFATLAQTADNLLPGLATPDQAGLVLLVDDDEPEHLSSEQRVPTAATLARLLERGIYELTEPVEDGQRVALRFNEQQRWIGTNVAPDTFDDTAKRGTPAQKGLTSQLVKLMGGLWLDQILPLPPDTTGYGLVWDKVSKKVYYTTGGATAPVPVVSLPVFTAHYVSTPIGPVTPPFTVPPGSPPLLAGNKSGSLDEGSCDYVGGWAAQRDDLNQTLQVDIYLNGAKHTTVAANQLRPDVAMAIGSAINKYFGYGYDVPPSLRTGVALSWSAFIAGTQIELTFSPKRSNVCGLAQTSVVDTFPDGPDQLTEGGAVGNYVLKEKLSDGSFRTIRPDAWELPGAPSGITIDQNGTLTPGSNSISSNVTLGLIARLGANRYQKSVTIVNTNPAGPALSVTRFPDTVINATGNQTISIVSAVTGGTAPFDWLATDFLGNALPPGLQFTDSASPKLTIFGDYPNQQIVIRRRTRDAAQNVVFTDFLLTVARPTAPARTLTSDAVEGTNFMNEGTSASFRRIARFSDGSSEDRTGQSRKSLEGWRPGELIDNEGSVTIPPNAAQGDGHELIVVMIDNVTNARFTKSTQVVDVSQVSDRPPGTENCTGYGQLTAAQFNAAPQVFLYSYYEGNGVGRLFASRAETISLMPGKDAPSSPVNFSIHKVSSAAMAVGTTVYRAANNGPVWPLGAGFTAYDVTMPADGQDGVYTLLEFNACGQITSRETIILSAN